MRDTRWGRKEARERKRKGWGTYRKTKATLSREVFWSGIHGRYNTQEVTI